MNRATIRKSRSVARCDIELPPEIWVLIATEMVNKYGDEPKRTRDLACTCRMLSWALNVDRYRAMYRRVRARAHIPSSLLHNPHNVALSAQRRAESKARTLWNAVAFNDVPRALKDYDDDTLWTSYHALSIARYARVNDDTSPAAFLLYITDVRCDDMLFWSVDFTPDDDHGAVLFVPHNEDVVRRISACARRVYESIDDPHHVQFDDDPDDLHWSIMYDARYDSDDDDDEDDDEPDSGDPRYAHHRHAKSFTRMLRHPAMFELMCVLVEHVLEPTDMVELFDDGRVALSSLAETTPTTSESAAVVA